jgi:hypothetical protein
METLHGREEEMSRGIALAMILIWLFYFWFHQSMNGSGPRKRAGR